MRVAGEFSKSFVVEVGVRKGCVMSPWLFNILMDGCMRKMKCKVVNAGAKLNEEVCFFVTCLFADDTVLLAESEGGLHREPPCFAPGSGVEGLAVDLEPA